MFKRLFWIQYLLYTLFSHELLKNFCNNINGHSICALVVKIPKPKNNNKKQNDLSSCKHNIRWRKKLKLKCKYFVRFIYSFQLDSLSIFVFPIAFCHFNSLNAKIELGTDLNSISFKLVKIKTKPIGSNVPFNLLFCWYFFWMNKNNTFIYVLNTLNRNRIMPATWSRLFYSCFWYFFQMSFITCWSRLNLCSLHLDSSFWAMSDCWQPIFVVLNFLCTDLFPIYVSIEFFICQFSAFIVPYERLCLSSPHDWPAKRLAVFTIM